jgi:hypothetical protein
MKKKGVVVGFVCRFCWDYMLLDLEEMLVELKKEVCT